MKKYLVPLMAAAVLSSAPSYAQLTNMQDPFNSLFDTMIFSPQNFEIRQFAGPKMDIADLKDKVEVKAELPGLTADDVKLTCEDGILTLSGDKKTETEEQNKDYYLKETSSGTFSRSVRLPKNIDESKIEAVFKNGVLTISIPKTEIKDDAPNSIPIKTEN
ncbi:MAG: Hsp20/alpha crystallin family protein [Alphaproteobacteria bacterium]|nr:Hsp20/alpha crystallin family protein [Alphaproteobacteria bacterium]